MRADIKVLVSRATVALTSPRRQAKYGMAKTCRDEKYESRYAPFFTTAASQYRAASAKFLLVSTPQCTPKCAFLKIRHALHLSQFSQLASVRIDIIPPQENKNKELLRLRFWCGIPQWCVRLEKTSDTTPLLRFRYGEVLRKGN